VTALTLAGLPTDQFLFAGFLPNASSARRRALRKLVGVPATLVFYESPRRLVAMLNDVCAELGDRKASVCRELTKKFEEIRSGQASELAQSFAETGAKGEIVVLIDKPGLQIVSETDLEQEVNKALETMTVRDVADAVSSRLGVKRRVVYQMAMRLAEQRKDPS
jgi:16S rRNA (cytidine1402-2'-O)-methyltransferase